MNLAAWQIQNGAPARLSAGAIELEKHLEDWIAQDISLIDSSLLVIHRQLHVDGGFLDLLCVDAQGRATVIEIKRGKPLRDTIAQGLDYASSISVIDSSVLRERITTYLGCLPSHHGLEALLADGSDVPREVAVIVVGVGRDPGLHRLLDFLGNTGGLPIRAVTFDVFVLANGEKVLVREETEPEATPTQSAAAKVSAQGVIDAAGGPDSLEGKRVIALRDALERNGLYLRPYRWSFMATPPQNRTRGLFVFGRWSGKVQLSFNAQAIAEFFPTTPERVVAKLGPPDTNFPFETDEFVREWIVALDELFEEIRSAGSATD